MFYHSAIVTGLTLEVQLKNKPTCSTVLFTGTILNLEVQQQHTRQQQQTQQAQAGS